MKALKYLKRIIVLLLLLGMLLSVIKLCRPGIDDYFAEVYGGSNVHRAADGTYLLAMGGANTKHYKFLQTLVPEQIPDRKNGYALKLDKEKYKVGEPIGYRLTNDLRDEAVYSAPNIDYYYDNCWYTIMPSCYGEDGVILSGQIVSGKLGPRDLWRHLGTGLGEEPLYSINEKSTGLMLRKGRYRMTVEMDGYIICDEFLVV